MKKSRVLVKNLTVIETLSCVNVIASDKTGTLTQNKMFVASAAAGIDKIDLDEASSSNYERLTSFNQLVTCCGLCNNAAFEDNDTSIPVRQRKAKGDATDIAIFKFSAEYQNLKDINQVYEVKAEIPFNSKNKWMVKVIRPKDKETHTQVFGVDDDMDNDIILLKGAPDYLVKKSTHVLLSDGSMTPIKTNIANTLVQIQNDWCVLGQRVLIICKKKCNIDDVMPKDAPVSDLEKYVHESNDFCIIGLVGIIDPPREGIADVLAKCKSAGIRVLMVTGDYALTAAAIAVQIGILSQPQYDTAETMRIKHKEGNESYDNSSLLLTGNDLDTLTTEDWRLVTPYKEIVLARTTPEQKLRTVKEFQNDKYIVGVTGDGVNDAPALKSADIGIAMGSGSEVAMEASQLVLLDNNFASILIAIENGRLVFDNLRKVILFLLPAGSMGDFIPIVMAIFLGVPLNISSFGMLLISIITDIPPSLAMMKEPPETDLLSQPPRTKKDHLTDKKFLLQAYIFMGILVVLSSQIMFFIYMKWYMNMDPSQIFLAFDKIYANYNASNYEYLKTVINVSDQAQLVAYFNDQYYSAQTVTFTALVVVQTYGNLLCTRTHIKSFFQQPPWSRKKGNSWFFVGQIVAIFFLLIFIYIPVFHSIFNTRSLPAQFLFLPLIFCLIIFVADELRKLAVRRKFLFFHKVAW
jgi:sodium/potassium-transporting ATPase subunit alpha